MHPLKRAGGDREVVEILALVLRYYEQAVQPVGEPCRGIDIIELGGDPAYRDAHKNDFMSNTSRKRQAGDKSHQIGRARMRNRRHQQCQFAALRLALGREPLTQFLNDASRLSRNPTNHPTVDPKKADSLNPTQNGGVNPESLETDRYKYYGSNIIVHFPSNTLSRRSPGIMCAQQACHRRGQSPLASTRQV
jgi:hypothetical protein